MFTLFKDGFAKDLVVLILVSVLVGSLVSTGVAYAVDTYFGDTIDGLIGEYGEYDAILHFREDSKEAGLGELKRLIEERLQGASFKEGPTLVGQANVFLSLPEELKTKEILGNFRSYFESLPGYNGYTLMVEPSLVVNVTNRAIRDRLMKEIEEINAVKFAFHNGNSIYAMLDSFDSSKKVTDQVKVLLDAYQVVEVRFPMGYTVDDPSGVAYDIMQKLDSKFSPRVLDDITFSEMGEDTQDLIKTLSEMKRFLMSYASKVNITNADETSLAVGSRLVLVPVSESMAVTGRVLTDEDIIVEIKRVRGGILGLIAKGEVTYDDVITNYTAYKLVDNTIGDRVGDATVTNERFNLLKATEESIKLLNELEGLAADANETVRNAEGTLQTFQAALVKLNELQQQMALLQQSLAGRANDNLFFSLLLKQLLSGLLEDEGGTGIGGLENLDIEAMQENLTNIAARIQAIDTLKIDQIIQEIQKVQESLPNLKDEEISTSIGLIEKNMSGQVIPGERITLLTDGSLSVKNADIVDAVGMEEFSVLTMPVGVVSPDARAELFRVLKEVRATIAGLLALVITILFLILDHSAIMSTMKRLVRDHKQTHRWSKLTDPVKLFGALTGAILLTGIYVGSQAKIPLLGVHHILLFGALIGVAFAALADRISPINNEEIMAGQALGLPYVQIMREIVVPAGRPGLMTLINRTKQQF